MMAPSMASATSTNGSDAPLGGARRKIRLDGSPAGAQGIAQFMPQTAAALGLDDPFDAERAIDAQAHLMRDLLRRFASVPLALAAYNAGPAPVAACGCIPPYPETRGYVARILGLLGGAGQATGGGLTVRLVK
jgi:soluble lytic murein transglycosylase-like protein